MPGASQVLFALTAVKTHRHAGIRCMRKIKSKEEKRMRLDKFLKVSRLIKRRTVANDRPAKASGQVKPGDVIEIGFGTKSVKVEVLDVQETTKKEQAKDLFKYL